MISGYDFAGHQKVGKDFLFKHGAKTIFQKVASLPADPFVNGKIRLLVRLTVKSKLW